LPICEFRDGFYVIDPEGEVSIWPESDEENWANIWHWAQQVWLQE